MVQIGKKNKAIRNKRGITQIQLSEMTLIEQTVISRYENGIITPPISKLDIIAKALGVTVSELLDDRTA